MNIEITINGSMTPDLQLQLSVGLNDDEENEVCISFVDKEIDLYVNFNQLKAAVEAIALLKAL
jgi:hypothetical protein